MSDDGTTAFLQKRNYFGAVFAASFASLVLSGCSSVPDAVNPVEWYKGTVDFFAGEETEDSEQTAEQADAMKASTARTEKKDFPTIASVPERPKPAEGLVGDTSGRRYADAPTRQGEPVNALADAGTSGAVAPPPPSVPTTPVTSAPLDAAQPQSPQMAVAPAPVADDRPTDVLDVYRQGLAQTRPQQQQLASAESRATTMFDAPAMGMHDFGTVVISSDGVDGMAPSAAAMTASSAPAVTVDDSVGGESLRPVSTQGMTKVATILFDNGGAGLTARDRGILKQVQKLARQYNARVHVVGHASSRTRNMDVVRHKMVNYQVSVKRAEKVADALVRLGVPQDAVTMDARSDSDPVYYEIMPSGEAGNRRAEVYLAF